MKPALRNNPEPVQRPPCKTQTWLDMRSSSQIRAPCHLPCVHLKCTSMIMDSINFNINYSAPFTPSICRSCNSLSVSELYSLQKKNTFYPSGQQAPETGFQTNKGISEKPSKHSNVRVTMQYLGTGFSVVNEIINPKDEVKMFQQICGGENICVYKGYLSPGDTFQFISKRHYGFPFSASIYINGLIAARISSCCEYRYHVGFQQGRHGCFRICQISGGTPCYRCIDFHNQKKIQITEERENVTSSACTESVSCVEKVFTIHELKFWPGESKSLKPNFIEDEKKEDTLNKLTPENSYTNCSDIKQGLSNVQRSLQALSASAGSNQRRLRKKRVKREESDSEQENILYRRNHSYRKWRTARSHKKGAIMQAVQRRLAEACTDGNTPCSEVEFSDSSDSSQNPSSTEPKWAREDTVKAQQEIEQSPNEEQTVVELTDWDTSLEIPDDEEVLQSQIADLITVLQESDEVDQLVLRNTGLTDDLLQRLTAAISESKSEVEKINLNLNELSPKGAQSLIQLLEPKPCLKSLLLHGNQLGDDGISILMNGLSNIYTGHRCVIGLPLEMSNKLYTELIELDIGGNQISTRGLRSVASYVRLNLPLKFLGLSQTTIEHLDAWKDLFDALKTNTNINHLLLDENKLGDKGAQLLADVIKCHRSIVTIDLDNNDIGEGGGCVIAENLNTNTDSALKFLSLEGNHISSETLGRIQSLLAMR